MIGTRNYLIKLITAIRALLFMTEDKKIKHSQIQELNGLIIYFENLLTGLARGTMDVGFRIDLDPTQTSYRHEYLRVYRLVVNARFVLSFSENYKIVYGKPDDTIWGDKHKVFLLPFNTSLDNNQASVLFHTIDTIYSESIRMQRQRNIETEKAL